MEAHPRATRGSAAAKTGPGDIHGEILERWRDGEEESWRVGDVALRGSGARDESRELKSPSPILIQRQSTATKHHE
jgi:hypothetical protein